MTTCTGGSDRTFAWSVTSAGVGVDAQNNDDEGYRKRPLCRNLSVFVTRRGWNLAKCRIWPPWKSASGIERNKKRCRGLSGCSLVRRLIKLNRQEPQQIPENRHCKRSGSVWLYIFIPTVREPGQYTVYCMDMRSGEFHLERRRSTDFKN